MRTPKRILAALLSVLAGLVYVWFAAVRAVPGVRRRKEAARRARAGRPGALDPK
jgi:HAMP domain-containing protein